MSDTEFTIDDLRRILVEGAGAPDGPGVDTGTLDVDFGEIGYESLALLECGGRIEREYGVHLDEGQLAASRTPRALVTLVNEHITELSGKTA